MGKLIDCTKSITNLFEFHFEIPGHEPHYVLLEETAQSLAKLGACADIEALRTYFGAKLTWKAAFYLSFVAEYFEECAIVLMDFADHADRNIQFDAGAGLVKSDRYRGKGLEILTRLADSFLRGDTYQISRGRFHEFMEEPKVSALEGLDDLKRKIQLMDECPYW